MWGLGLPHSTSRTSTIPKRPRDFRPNPRVSNTPVGTRELENITFVYRDLHGIGRNGFPLFSSRFRAKGPYSSSAHYSFHKDQRRNKAKSLAKGTRRLFFLKPAGFIFYFKTWFKSENIQDSQPPSMHQEIPKRKHISRRTVKELTIEKLIHALDHWWQPWEYIHRLSFWS